MPRKQGRPPIENPKNVRLEIRLTQEQSQTLTYCAEQLSASKTDIIKRGIELVKAELDAK